ncbi:MAG TPA: ABC transporter ATP-binding protein, partial [Gemmatirosa sp.]
AESARFDEDNAEYARRNIALARLNGVMNPAFGLLAGVGAAVVLGGGGTLALRGTISVGAFVAFGLYLAMLTWPLIALGWTTNLFQRGAASMARINELLDATPALAAAARPRALPPAAAGRTLEFRNVSFHYPRASNADARDEPVRWILRDVSFTVPAGATFGIVGPVGSGKSTLLDLVPRLYDPQAGEVLLDGVPIRELTLDALRREIGVVPQESLLFSETIRANIRYGTDEATDGTTVADPAAPNEGGVAPRLEEATSGATEPTSHDLVVWAADIADLTTTVVDFPGGFDTLLGERGVNLSGGQKQRAAIARALARRPAVVLLDDALSAVDTQTEAAILRGLRTALAGRTTLITTHRVSAVRDAAWILVLDEGRVVEQGTHDALLARGGRYAALARRQQLEAEVEDGTEAGAVAGAGATA